MATLKALMATSRVVAVANALLAMAPHDVDNDVVHAQARIIVHANETSGGFGKFVEFLVNGGAAVDGGVDIPSLTLRSITEIHQRAKSNISHPVEARMPSRLNVVSFDALHRAQTTLEDFTNFYFSIHGLSHADFFRWLPLLVFTEACIYQLDEDNERACLAQSPSANVTPTTVATEVAMRGVLSSEGLLSHHVVDELAAGQEYWALERKLCGSMALCKPLDLEEVYRCSSLKSFVRRGPGH